MSWGEVKKIAEKIDLMSMHRDIFVGNATYTVPISGRYRIIAIGKGATGYDSGLSYYGGAAGGIGILETVLTKGDEYNVTVGTNASFGNLITATGGTSGTGGTASGNGVIAYAGGSPNRRNGGDVAWTMGNLSMGGTASGTVVGRGGKGAFGGDGGTGGICVEIDAYADTHFIIPAGSGTNGGGAGGTASFSAGSPLQGGGGGGGFGGGGGWGQSRSGEGGAAAVIIQYLGF